jgi:hypothetical protein
MVWTQHNSVHSPFCLGVTACCLLCIFYLFIFLFVKKLISELFCPPLLCTAQTRQEESLLYEISSKARAAMVEPPPSPVSPVPASALKRFSFSPIGPPFCFYSPVSAHWRPRAGC